MSEISMIASYLSITTSLYLIMSHPLLLVILLVTLTLLIMSHLILLFNCSWLMLILFLIFLGGLLVIFTYLSALVPNELMKNQSFWLVMILSPFFTYNFFTGTPNSNQTLSLEKMNMMNEKSFVMFLLLYLLMSLMVTMLMTQNFKTPLHQESH